MIDTTSLDETIKELSATALKIKAERDFLIKQLEDDADVDCVDGRYIGNYPSTLLAMLEGFRDGYLKPVAS